MEEREHLQRADHAQALLEHPLLKEALEHYETEITEAWKTQNASPADRERLHQMLKAAQHFRRYLQSTVETGQLIRAKVMPSPLRRAARVIGMR